MDRNTSQTYSLDPVFFPDTCAECPQGSFSLESASSCTACTPGYYASSTGSSECTPCEPGYFSTEDRVARCTACAPGSRSAQYSGSTSCTICGPGEFAPGGTSTCEQCSPGSFSLGNLAACNLCPAGQFASGFGQTFCSACLPGSFSLEGAGTCDPCSEGTFQPSSNGTSFCIDCSPGTFADTTGRTVCSLCNFGSFSGFGMGTCEECPDYHNTTGRASTSIGDCIKQCTKGTSGYNGVEPCTVCRPGTNSSGNGTLCSPVPESVTTAFWPADDPSIEAGTEYEVNGTCAQGACPPCIAGYFAEFEASELCLPCPLDTYSDIVGSNNCTSCDEGEITFQQGSSYEGACVGECPLGQSSPSGNKPCLPCEVGTYAPTKARTACLLCPFGEYQGGTGASSCLSCPPGLGTLREGSTLVTECVGYAPKRLEDEGKCDASTQRYSAL